VDTKHGNEVRMEVSTEIPFPNFDITKVDHQKIKQYVNIFESSVLIKTNLWVSHNRFVSVYNILTQSWQHHVKFKNRVELIRKRDEGENYSIAILERQQGNLYLHVADLLEENEDEKEVFSFEDVEPDRRIEDEILQTVQDKEDSSWFLILTKDRAQNVPRLHTLYRNELYDITRFVDNLKLKSNLVMMFAPDETSIFLIQNK